jgi:hypothetical protein
LPDGWGGKRVLVHKGTHEYIAKDVLVEVKSGDGMSFKDESVVLPGDFRVGASVHPDEKLTGFGLWMEKPPSSFSWEWFDLDKDMTFKKLKGGGSVKVTVRGFPVMEEMASVEFLDDITLRMRDDTLCKAGEDVTEKKTHMMIVKKGSVLLLP